MSENAPITDQKPKWFLQSKTILGIIIMLVPSVANLFGVSIPVDQVETLRDGLLKIVEAAMTVAGAGLAVYGRFKAKRPITVDDEK